MSLLEQAVGGRAGGVIGHEADQRKNEEAVQQIASSTASHTLEMIEHYREQEDKANGLRCHIGDLAVARCWPYLDMYRVCVVTRVDDEGYATHLRDGAGIRYAHNARETKKATIMPEHVFIVPRERLSVPARKIAARYREAHFAGISGAQGVMDKHIVPYLKEGVKAEGRVA